MKTECIRIPLLLLLLTVIIYEVVSNNIFADSPPFVRQVVIDRPDDWFMIKSRMDTSPIYTSEGDKILIETGKSLNKCTTTEPYQFFDISAVSYFSNGKNLNATIWLYHPLKQPPLNATEWLTPPIKDDPWYRIIYGMAIGIHSAYDVEGSDYHARNVWNVYDEIWTEILEEMPPTINETKVSYVKDNDATLIEGEKNHIDLSLDLSRITYPDRYSLLFYTQYIFIKDGYLCALSDISSQVSIPPPEFTISTSPNNIDLRPGEEKTIRLQIKSDTNTKSEVSFSTNETDDIKLNPYPKRTFIPPYGLATVRLHIGVSEDARPFEYLLPLSANMSIPTESKMRGNVINDLMRNSVSANVTENSNLTLTVLPQLRTDEHLNNFVSSWITPISGMWSFLAGVAIVIGPLVIRLYTKKKQNKNKNKRLGDWF